jgi:site-specific DNA recombinase
MRKDVANVRCCVYTRKSTEERLDQEFNSLQAQREAGEAFILSQKHMGWILTRLRSAAIPASQPSCEEPSPAHRREAGPAPDS